MKAKSLTGRLYNFPPIGHIIKGDESRPRSDLHLKARELLKLEFPTSNILEEVYLEFDSLYLDFYLPLQKWAIEVSGRQHTEYVKFFHKDLEGFRRAKMNDQRKADWCALNGVRLIYFPYNKSVDEWKMLLWE